MAFAEFVLGVKLWPWQIWLLIHALELNPDGSYRFKRIIVLVARQQGKTTLCTVLAAWWLFVDSGRHPERTKPVDFRILGVAQNRDIAAEPWKRVRMWSDPDPRTDEERAQTNSLLAPLTLRVSDTNGDEEIRAKSMAWYEYRAAENTRGKPVVRLIFDELREQKTTRAWDAVADTVKQQWSGQIWGMSNAGWAASIVLSANRAVGVRLVEQWLEKLGTTERWWDQSWVEKVDEWSSDHDVTVGHFEWSAPEHCGMKDVPGILAANPSIGYGPMTIQTAFTSADLVEIGKYKESSYRTETLCQWVTVELAPFPAGSWDSGTDSGSRIPDDGRLWWGLDVSPDRGWASIGVCGKRTDGDWHVEVAARRPGMTWVSDWLRDRCSADEPMKIALQGKGSVAAALITDLKGVPGLEIVECSGVQLGIAAGRLWDGVAAHVPGRDAGADVPKLWHPPQPPLDQAADVAATRPVGDGVWMWDRDKSPVDIAPLVSVSMALWLATFDGKSVASSAYEDSGLMVV